MIDNPMVCEHGQLRRVCYVCELESERAEDARVMLQALEALKADEGKLWPRDKRTAAINALRTRLGETT
jgi:hypothetical protein